MTWSNLSKRVGAVTAMLGSGAAQAAWELNLPRGVTPMTHEVYDLHMMILWVCVAIGVVVFGAMFYSIYAHRKSRGAEPAHFHESTIIEVSWTVVPILILIAVVIPTAGTLIEVEDSSDPDLTIQVTGYQWLWHYKYLDEGVAFYSRLSAASNRARVLNSDVPPTSVEHYLRAVDNRVVVPIDQKVRLLLTSKDVIHSWWVPELAGKKDAIPGYVNDIWFRALKTGIYRGQCAELCGRGHAYMPIVVQVVSQERYEHWLKLMRAGQVDKARALLPDEPGATVALQEPTSPPSVVQVDHGEDLQEAPAAAAAAAGSAVAADGAESRADQTGMTKSRLMAAGEKVYNSRCASCHQVDGSGLPAAGFPPIQGSPVATGPLSAHIDWVLDGKNVMPAFGNILDNRQIAAVITYERNAFGNATGDVVQPEQIQARR